MIALLYPREGGNFVLALYSFAAYSPNVRILAGGCISLYCCAGFCGQCSRLRKPLATDSA